jgi:predicted DNA binding CopG/RHH family protein
MQASEDKTILISIKIKESLLAAFRQKCELEGVKYQTQIKTLMSLWLEK